jgi:uncharacterized protein (TIGR00251 family)
MPCLSEDAGGVTVDILVSPRASRPRVGPVTGDRLKIAVTAPPVDGEANEAVIALLARTLDVPRARIRIVQGQSGRRKRVRIDGVTAVALEPFLR